MHIIWLTVFSLPEVHDFSQKMLTMLTEQTSLQKSDIDDFLQALLPVYYFNKVLSFSYCYDGLEFNLC